MYVTRRFLRSTIPSPPDAEEARKRAGNSDEECVPEEPSPRRHPALRASKKAAESVKNAGSSSSSKKQSPKPRKAAGQQAKDGASATSAKTQGKQKTKSDSATTSKKNDSVENSNLEKGSVKDSRSKNSDALTADAAQYVGYGMLVDARDTRERWCEAKIVDLDAKKKRVFVHYVGWNARYDAWITVKYLAAHGSHTGETHKDKCGWDGKTPLFAMESEVKEEEKSDHHRKPTGSSSSKKKASLPRHASPVASRKRRAHEESEEPTKDGDDEAKEEEEASDTLSAAKRAKRGAAQVKMEPMQEDATSDSKTSPKATKKQPASAASGKAKVHPVRVVVATTDEVSERKSRRSRKDNVDMELDMEIRCDESSQLSSSSASDAEEEADDSDSSSGKNKASKSRKKSKRQQPSRTKIAVSPRETSGTWCSSETINGKRSKGKASVHDAKKRGKERLQTASVSSSSSCPQSSNASMDPNVHATKEKLAAIFRLRLHQKQQMGQLGSSSSSPARSLQEELLQTAAGPSSSSSMASIASNDAQGGYSSEAAAREAYIHYHNAQQIQQYYYQQAMMSQMRAGGASSDDAAAALQGGIMDPRVIQARMDALEMQRQMQQQQLHEYYQQQSAVSRERNLEAFASTQAFLANSEKAWQDQTLQSQTHCEEGAEGEAGKKGSEKESESVQMSELEEKMRGGTAASTAAETTTPAERKEVEPNNEGKATPPVSEQSGTEAGQSKSGKAGDGSSTRTNACVSAKQDDDDGGVLYEFVL